MAQTGRAELLRALHLGAGDSLALEHDDHGWWGYQRQADEAPSAPSVTMALPELVTPPPSAPPPRPEQDDDPLRQPLQMPATWVVQMQHSRDLPRELQGLPQLTERDLRALAPEPLPYRDLVPWARALPGLRRHTDRQVPGGIDWPRLAAALARQNLPRRPPRRHWQRWPQQVILVLDFSPRLAPYRWDFHRLALQLDAQLPAATLSVRVLQHGPAGPWTAWSHPRKPRPWQPPQDWEEHLAPGTVLLLATDLGLFDDSPAAGQAWLDWRDALCEQGCRLIALAPVGAAQLSERVVNGFELVRWSADSRWHRERRAPAGPGIGPSVSAPVSSGDPAPPATDPRLEALVALAATALRMDPPLLRAWRSLLPGGGDAGLEGRLWNHPHLEAAGLTCATRSEHLDADLARHAALPLALRQAARAVQVAQHAHLRQSLGWGEALRWGAAQRAAAMPGHAPEVAAGTTAGAMAMDDPLGFVKRLLHTLADPQAVSAGTSRHSLVGAAELIQAAASLAVRAQDPVLFAALDAAVARWRTGLVMGPADPVEGEATALPRLWMLVQQGSALRLVPTGAPDPGQPLGMPVLVPASTQHVWLRSRTGSRWLPLPDLDQEPGAGIALATLGDGQDRLMVVLERHAWAVSQEARPWWAARWQQVHGETAGGVPSPSLALVDGQPEWAWFTHPSNKIRLDGGGTFAAKILVKQVAPGVVADVPLQPPRGQATGAPADLTLRLRWIPPGRFLMGSPDGEGDGDEHPQHPVLISQGFWLAEGPCTQALWLAVMGDNPSHFKDAPDAAQRPVEQVSFDDVQQFLQRLRDWLPAGCEPVLPTEAQWEYAARAGSTTAYPWGDASDDSRANWGRQHQGTTPVGQFQANAWGLLDMHGNVWEWCADGRRGYTAQPQRDPQGELEGPPGRAVRGGSWIDHPGIARSAYRTDGHPDYRYHNRGFRLALKSSSPGAGGARVAGAGRPGDNPGWVQTLLGKFSQALAPSRKGSDKGKKGRR